MMRSLARRALTVPAVFAGFGLALASLPLWVAVAAITDLASRGRRTALRCGAFALWYLACEAGGLLLAAALIPVRLAGRDAFRRANRRLQDRWGTALFRGAQLGFGVRLEAENAGCAAPGPILLLVRHATIVDTLIPTLAVSAPYDMDLRYVLKRELLWDPCLDIVGHRMGHYFARRGGADTERELAGVVELARGLGPRDGVLIYPEGTRFTPAKRERVLERIAASGDGTRLARARALEHVLPPRTGGTLALLDAAPEADVVICAHTGLEATTGFADLLHGSARGRVLRACFWRIPRRDVPEDAEGRIAWLQEQWRRVDRWIDAHRAAPAPRR